MKKFINLGVIFRAFGVSITIIGLFMLTALPFAYYYNENTIWAFGLSSFIALAFGQLFSIKNKKNKIEQIGEREAFIIVTLTWFMLGLFGSLPYLISGAIPNYTNAYFETISGLTTTGATILDDIEALPKSILYWRSLTQWLGGMGILVLVIAFLPQIGFGGVKLFIAEAPGPTTTKLHPKIRQTAIRLWLIYTSLTILQILLLIIGNMNIYEAICHSLSTLSTGGFSPKNTSIAEYSSFIKIVITVFMLFGGINFALYYFFIKGKFKKVLANEELLSYVIFIIIVSSIIASILFLNGNYNITDSLIHSFFQSISIITTTGFITSDYELWPQVTLFLLLLLFFCGGMIGSTGGGIKFTRHLILFKNIRNEIKKILHPNAIIPLRLNKQLIADEVVRNFFIVFISYIFVFCIGTIVLSFYVNDFTEAFGITVSSLGNIGPAFGEYGAVGNYANIDDIAKWILSVLMIIGRLEVIAILILFHFSFWKK